MRKRGKGRLPLDVAIRVQHGIEGRIEGIYARAMRESLSHAQLLEIRQREINADPQYQRLPQWSKCEVSAVWRGADRALHATGLVRWTHRIDGEIVQSKDVHGPEQWARVTSCHEWAHSGKPYGEPGPAKSE